jgi:hypothetical protein
MVNRNSKVLCPMQEDTAESHPPVGRHSRIAGLVILIIKFRSFEP